MATAFPSGTGGELDPPFEGRLANPFFGFNSGQWPLTSRCLIDTKAMMTASQYKLYEMTEPYVAELVQPRMALKKPQPLPPFSSGLQHCGMVSIPDQYLVMYGGHIR